MRILKILGCLGLIVMLSSCYSVRFQVDAAMWEPSVTERNDTYDGYNVYTLDTVVTRKMLTGEHYFNIFKCPPRRGLHTVEYRSTFGGVLLNAITFGRKKKVKIKYVCIKENS